MKSRILLFLIAIAFGFSFISESPELAYAKAPKSNKTVKKEVTVYITRTGAKYHESWCRYLRRSKIPISLSEARKSYGACSVCQPPK